MSQGTKKKSAGTPPAAPPSLPPGCEALLGKRQICFAVGVSARTFDSMVSAGQFPKPDARVGALPKWHVDTLNGWIRRKCAKPEGGG